MNDSKRKPILCVDFDGVLHSYSSGWKGPRNIPDPPVDGAIGWLEDLLGCPRYYGYAPEHKDFKVCIYSSRSRYIGGKRAMKKWLVKHGLDPANISLISFPTRKPPAFLQIDDRAITFKGTFPSVEEMKAFKPWNKGGNMPRMKHEDVIEIIDKGAAKLQISEVLHILRNPYGWSRGQVERAQLQACDEIENWKDAYENLLDWCHKNNLDTTTRNG